MSRSQSDLIWVTNLRKPWETVTSVVENNWFYGLAKPVSVWAGLPNRSRKAEHGT